MNYFAGMDLHSSNNHIEILDSEKRSHPFSSLLKKRGEANSPPSASNECLSRLNRTSHEYS